METEQRRRYDERDNVQGRLELIPDTPAWEQYYKEHSALKDADLENQRLDKIPVGHPADNMATDSIMLVMRNLSREDTVDGPVSLEKIEMTPERASEKIKGLAAYLGIDVVRIGPLDPMYIYSHKGRMYGRHDIGEPEVGTEIDLANKHAIVLVNSLDTTLLRGAPKKQVMFAVYRAYLQLGIVAVTLAQYIRKLGYPARAHIIRNYQVIVPPIAVDAGVGEIGRNGLVISKEFGQAIKMSVVTTDLPMVYDEKTALGVEKVCSICKICAEKCPAGAINHGGKKMIRGAERYPFNPEACFKVWKTTGTDCGVCIVSCPFSRDASLRDCLGVQLASPGEELPRELISQIERMRSERHDPGAQAPYPWMESQPPVWEKYRYGK